ncbi:primase-helicase family protein [Undibacterium sp. Di27W]|uniref:primase-helicase family protein n=1 Tax=Undibacterium sp. Di27W TaxID=3413036 RepID=UPI003BF3EA68
MNSPLSKVHQAIAAVKSAIFKASRPRVLPNTPICDLLLHICNKDEDLALFVARWIAFPLIRKGTKMDTALVVIGPNNVGKSLFFEHIVTRLHPEYARATIRKEELLGRFNGWTAQKNYVVVDDFNPMWQSDSIGNECMVKAYLSSGSFRRAEKAREPVSQVNRMNFVFLSFRPAETESTRRFIVINTPEPREEEFYGKLFANLSDDDIEGFKHWLMHGLDMRGFNRSSTFIPF